MRILLYNCADDANHIPKHMTLLDTITGSLREESSLENPTIRIQASAYDFNYVFIPDNNRYYYVIDIVSVRTGIVDIVLKVDVLQSFYKQFMYSPMICSRSDSTYNKFITDNRRKYEQRQEHEFVNIGRFSDDFDIILVGLG